MRLVYEAMLYPLLTVLMKWRCSLFGRTFKSPSPNDANRNMKSAKKRETKTEEPHQDLVTVKAESESEEAFEVCVGEDGFHIQIKEEPHSQEIGEEQGEDTSDCKSGTVTSDSDGHQQEDYIKEEHHSIHVKEEEELWLKDERDSDEGEADEREEEGTGCIIYFLYLLHASNTSSLNDAFKPAEATKRPQQDIISGS